MLLMSVQHLNHIRSIWFRYKIQKEKKNMSFANSNPFRIVKASATSESGNENTLQQLAATTIPS